MAQPTAYNRQYSFANFQSSSPSDPLPAQYVDAELNAIKLTLDAVLSNLALIQRDDGEIANNSVGTEQLESNVLVGVSEPTTWATLTDYTANDTVFNGYKFYICAIAHTSGTFATDLAAVKWTLIADFSTAFTDATTAAATATTKASEASVSAAAALVSQNAASSSASTASGHASTATTKASEASVSAAAALVSENAAAASASAAANYGTQYKGTSVSSVAIATGAKGFTTQAGKFFDVGTWLLIVDDANSANYMHGYVTAYSSTSLTVEVTNIGGSGTKTAWTITVAGTRGATGATGATGAGSGDLLAANNLSDLANAATARGNLGVGSANSPEFAAVNIGAATDTTLARVSAGVVSIEGDPIATMARANTFTAAQTISTTGVIPLTLISSDAGGALGPYMYVYRNSASPAASDTLGGMYIYGNDSAGNVAAYAFYDAGIVDTTNGSEDGVFRIGTVLAGTTAYRVHVGAGVYADGVTGGDKGIATLNFTTLYQGGTALSAIYAAIGGTVEFAALNIGHASDTTVSRASAGNLAIEGNLVYRAGGTDVPVTDGGTGASTAADARANLGAAALATSSTFPVGFTGVMRYTSGTSLADGATTAGTNVRTPAYTGDFGSAGLNVATGGVQTGTWRNDNGTTLQRISSNNDGEQFGYMTRTA